MAGELLGRKTVQLTVEDADCKGGLAIALTQTPVSGAALTSRYRVEVRAKTDDGMFIVGSFSTCPPVLGSPPTRVVAMASCPGALSWILYVTPYKIGIGADDFGDLSGMIHAMAGEPGGQLPGVIRVGERPKYYSGTGVGAVGLQPGERVVGWSAFATGAVGTVTIDGGTPIPIPNGGGVAGNGGGLLVGSTFVFTNTAGWLIEVAESA